ncbi:helix-turn-helix domain-containing protein [Brachybacterium sp. AOP3-A1-3]|uniref:helix-turn-helix domain-containing protein n=1 Tax=Brachybacterium sp. AOP3-A1-3 TaxID=3457699 RepID=UPI004034CA02
MDEHLEPLLRELMGAVLRDERRRQGRTLAQVAATAGISMQHLSDVERGRKDPSSELLAAITGALEVSVPQLLLRAADDALLRGRAEADERDGAGTHERFRGPALVRPETLDLTSTAAERTGQRAPGGEVSLTARPHLSLLSAA